MWVEMVLTGIRKQWMMVILFVRMWVEIKLPFSASMLRLRHPLREDVSWNTSLRYCRRLDCCHPLREDVSWNVSCLLKENCCDCHPLREDVSWNIGMAIKQSETIVILFVRMWVEIKIPCSSSFLRHGHPLREDVSWNTPFRISMNAS